MNASKALRVGLYFGSFNPVHLGHLVIANHMLHEADLDEVWFVVTPSSPHKQGVELIPEQHRLQMAHLAIADHPHLKAIDVEFALPRPNYTADTMIHLREAHPRFVFSIIMGQDNLTSFHTWKDHGPLWGRTDSSSTPIEPWCGSPSTVTHGLACPSQCGGPSSAAHCHQFHVRQGCHHLRPRRPVFVA